jgi:hypothetical protein
MLLIASVLKAQPPMISILVKCRLIYIVPFGTKTSIYQPIHGQLNTYQESNDEGHTKGIALYNPIPELA